MKAFRIVTVIVTGIISIAVLLTVNVGMTASAGGASSKEIKFSGQRVLFISPHPDNETVSCGGAIIRANAEADVVKVVWINDGDANPQAVAWFSGLNKPKPSDYRALGALRHEEVLRAGACLNMNGADEIFLSYPDGATNSLIKKDWNRTHLGANGYTSVSSPYAYNPGAVYQGDSLAKDLTQIIEKFRPTMIVYPDILDKHHDHWATGYFVELAVADA